MKRLHLVEIEDEVWCPRTLRDAATDYLRFALTIANPYMTIIPHLVEALRSTGRTGIVDLCAGGGGPWLQLIPRLRVDIPALRVTLTDLYPNVEAFAAVRHQTDVAYESRPVSALAPPADMKGFRTLFTSFHHFRQEEARRILESAVEAGEGIGIFEFTERRPAALGLMLMAPIIVWLSVPFIRPFRWSRIFWTYPVPVLPLVAVFDGLVSCARSYTASEMQEMTAQHATYEWKVGTEKAPRGPGRITYLIGVPRQNTGSLTATMMEK